MKKQILHIDVNNAFLSWSALYLLEIGHPIDIRTIPAIIGGDESKRAGIVLAKSQKAKEFGIVTGEPIFSARQKCPNIEIYPAKHKLYNDYSNKLYNILLNYTDKIERFSVDECFLDLTDALYKTNLYTVAKKIQERVLNELGFTVNIGLSNNKLLAKMASDFEKPNKIHTLYPDEIQTKMWNLPINNLFMLGRKTVPKLLNMNIRTIGDLARTNMQTIVKKFGKHGKLMWEYANGIDNSDVNSQLEKPKGVGNSVTLAKDITDISKLNNILFNLTEQVTYRLRRHQQKANVVTVQLRTKDFKDFTHQKKLTASTNCTKEIYIKAKQVLEEMYKGQAIRLVGVRVDKLVDEKQNQLSIFDKDNEKQEKIDKTIDLLKERYGYSKISRGKSH